MEEEDFFITVSQVQLKTHLAKCITRVPDIILSQNEVNCLRNLCSQIKFILLSKIDTLLNFKPLLGGTLNIYTITMGYSDDPFNCPCP